MLFAHFIASHFHANLNLKVPQPDTQRLKTGSNKALNSNPFLISSKSHHLCVSCWETSLIIVF